MKQLVWFMAIHTPCLDARLVSQASPRTKNMACGNGRACVFGDRLEVTEMPFRSTGGLSSQYRKREGSNLKCMQCGHV